jgi:S-adenosylmethionine synthetase
VRALPIVIEALRDQPVARRRMEVVERKGIGHPDTICDSLVEAISVGLSRMYLEELGAIPHYNVDKALLIAGQCAKGFGWGEMTRPMEFVVGDRATFEVNGRKLPVEETVRETVAGWLAAHLPRVGPGRDFVTRVVLASGSTELRSIFARGLDAIVANDTSGASGYAPLSPTEEIVLGVEQFLNGPAFKAAFPDTGQDVKVFGVREDGGLRLTVAMPMLAAATASENAYFRRKDEVLTALKVRFHDVPFAVDWRLNNLDAPGQGTNGVYLTLTGTSAEDADSGQVGRGNRANRTDRVRAAGGRGGGRRQEPGRSHRQDLQRAQSPAGGAHPRPPARVASSPRPPGVPDRTGRRSPLDWRPGDPAGRLRAAGCRPRHPGGGGG